MKKQNELFNAVLRELAAKEKELADQKWVFQRFLESPAWRWTAPVRWAVNQFRGLKNGHEPVPPSNLPAPSIAETIGTPESTSNLEAKSYFEDLCRISLETFLESGATLQLPQSLNPTVSVILVLFNRAELTLACLRSIAETHNLDLEVVVVDNDSQDETSQVLERLKGARIIKNDTNRHFLAGANQAARECRGEYLLLLNNDAQLLPGAIENALRTIRSTSDVGAVGGKIILLDGRLQEAGSIVWKDGSCAGYGRGDDPSAAMYNFRRDVDYCSGAFLLTPRKIWEQLNGFDPAFEPAYYEETDYCMRLWERGLRVVYEPSAAIIHYEFASSKSATGATRLQARNQKVFMERHRATLEGREGAGSEKFLTARLRNPQQRILFIDDRVPHLWLGSGFPRANAMHRVLQSMGYFVTSYPIDVIDEPWQQVYADLPREIEIMTGMGRHLLEAFLRNRRGYYSTLIVSRPHNMQLVASIRASHPEWFENLELIYDAEALFAEREVSRRKLLGNPMSDAEVRSAFESEIHLAAQADCVVTVSANEEKIFRSHGIRRVEVLGHSIEAIPGETSFESRAGFLFVGAVYNETSPNADSLIWFLESILPRIREKLGDVSFTIAGVNRSDRIHAMVHPPTKIVGHLPALDDLYAKARVFVAPTRFAGGIPHKIHEAAARGVPIVATPLLAKQLAWTDRELAIGETAEVFAERCVETYTDRQKWSGLRESALARVREECSPLAFENNLRRLFETRKGFEDVV